VIDFFFAVLRLACPLTFAALGGLLCERSGVINIALEGFLLIGAYAGAVATYSLGSPWLGMSAAVFVASFAALFYSYLVIDKKIDQVVAGIGVNLLVLGVLPFVNKGLFGSTGTSPTIPEAERWVYFPLIAMFGAVGLLIYVTNRTPFGLVLKFSGEHPEAVECAGFSVKRVRRSAVILGGVLASIGGMVLSVCLSSSYSQQMSGGRGFIALAAVILGKWRVGPTFLACLFFGLMDALQMRLQGVSIFGFVVPVQFIQISPYLLTVVALLNFLGVSRPPKALGTAF
jgi:simple sugar transport system permease protein